MSRFSLFKDFGDFIFSFKTRRVVLLVLLATSLVPGAFFWLMPAMARSWFFLIYVGLIAIGIVTQTMFLMETAESTIRTLLFGLRQKPVPFSNPEIDALAKRTGLFGKVKVYTTNNSWFKGAYANPLTSSVAVQASWVTSYPRSEIISVLGHEFAHLISRRRFLVELLVASVLPYAFSLALLTFTQVVLSTNLLLIVYYTAQVSMALLLVSFVSWRNEYRADMGGAKATGPEGLISVFENELAKSKRDDGSETHPPLSKRIQRLTALLKKE